jgi:hypothetical protein
MESITFMISDEHIQILGVVVAAGL